MNGSGQLAGLPPFANLVIRKLQRFDECAGDGQGADIGAQWFDVLTQLGLLKRVQRSPALWQITEQGSGSWSSGLAQRARMRCGLKPSP